MGLFRLFRKKTGLKVPAGGGKGKPKESVSFSVIDHSGNLKVRIAPIEERVKHLKPVAEGLYAHEILALSYVERYHLSGDDYPGFWWWRYGIKDVHEMLDSLLQRGFLCPGDAVGAMRVCTVGELKEFLKSQKLKVSGKKDELIERIVSEADPSSVQLAFPNRTYALTEKGRKVLEANSAIIEAHKDPELRIWDVPEKDLNRPPKTNDERWDEMNATYLKHAAAGNFGLAANTKLRMAEFLASEGRYVDAILSLCAAMATDLSGVGNNFNRNAFLSVGASSLFPYENSLATIPPGIIASVETWQKSARLSDEQLQGLLLKGFEQYEHSVPISVFTPTESLKIFNMERAKDERGLAKIYEMAERRFRKKYPTANLEF